MTSKPSEPKEEQVVEQEVEVSDDTLSEESLDQAAGGAWPLTISKYNTGQGG